MGFPMRRAGRIARLIRWLREITKCFPIIGIQLQIHMRQQYQPIGQPGNLAEQRCNCRGRRGNARGNDWRRWRTRLQSRRQAI